MATTNNPFDKLRFTGKDQEASIGWYRRKISELGKSTYTPGSLMNNRDLLSRRLYPGGLYLFYYDPKFKESLPYYDTFPLVYPYRMLKGGFMGYNLHYLPPVMRFKVMGTLLNIQYSTEREEKKLAYSYGVLNANDVQKYFEPCIKHYLNSHVMSRFLNIPSEDWLSAAVLPTERFVKASSSKVWKDTLGKV